MSPIAQPGGAAPIPGFSPITGTETPLPNVPTTPNQFPEQPLPTKPGAPEGIPGDPNDDWRKRQPPRGPWPPVPIPPDYEGNPWPPAQPLPPQDTTPSVPPEVAPPSPVAAPMPPQLSPEMQSLLELIRQKYANNGGGQDFVG